MRRVLGAAFLALASLLLGACIQGDEYRTFYVSPDGKVDLVFWGDNLKSGDKTPEGRKREEAAWLSDFRSGKQNDIHQLKQAGAKNVRTLLLREQVPFSAVVRGSLGSLAELGRYFGFDDDASSDSVRLTSDGSRRTLVFHIAAKPNRTLPGGAVPSSTPEPASGRQSVWKLVPVGGRILETRLCLPDLDQRACTLEMQEIEAHGRTGNGFDVSMSWETK